MGRTRSTGPGDGGSRRLREFSTDRAATARRTTAQGVTRALRVLEEFIKGPPYLGITDISGRVGLAPPVVQRIVNSLAAAGFLERSDRTRKYSLGLKVIELGATAETYNRLVAASRPVMHQLNERTGEVVLLAVLDRRTWRGAYLLALEGRQSASIRPGLQRQGYLHASSTRKVLLAFAADDEIREVINTHGLPRLTPRTITDPRALWTEVKLIRAKGFAVSRGEATIGTSGVAAPIRDREGTVIAGLGISMPDTRGSDERLAALSEQIVAAASEVTRRLQQSAG